MNVPPWGLLAILTSFLWGIVNVLDKTILYRYKLNPWDYLTLGGLIGVFPLMIIPWLSGNPFLISREAIVLATLSGLALAGFYLIYFFALKTSNVAIVVIFVQGSSLFSLVWGLTILHEHYVALAYLGMSLVLLGIGVASVSEKRWKGTPARTRFMKTLLASTMMLVASLILSIAYLAQKTSLQDASILSVFFWQRFCLFLVSLVIITVRRGKILRLPSVAIYLTSSAEVINFLALLSMIAAYSTGSLAAVTFLTSLQPLWVLVFVWLITSIRPSIILENRYVSKIQVVLACIFVISGLFLITIE
jgi:drug/metabolite transporter (DMT)-like permease